MATDAGICSSALALLGVPGIDSLLEESDNAETCAGIYPITLEAIIAEYPWRFTIQKKQLTKLATAPENEWMYAYQLPSDIDGEIHAVFNSGVVGAPIVKMWERFGKQIFTNYEQLWVDYKVKAVEANFPAHFTQLMIYEMTWKLAEPVTEDGDKMASWYKVTRGDAEEGGKGGYFRTATQIDAMGNTGSQIEDYTLINARMGDR